MATQPSSTSAANVQPPKPSLMRLDATHDHSYLGPNFYKESHHRHQVGGGPVAIKCAAVPKTSAIMPNGGRIVTTNHLRKTVLNVGQQQNGGGHQQKKVHINDEYEESMAANNRNLVNHAAAAAVPTERIAFFKPSHGHNHSHNSQTSAAAAAEFDDDEYDEDSNDTQSCSSSSGCSSSSNSMVGSVNRHLSLNNHQQQQQTVRYQNIPGAITTTTTASTSSCSNFLLKNGTGANNISNIASAGVVVAGAAPVATASSTTTVPVCQYKDLTPKQVKRRLDWDATPETATTPMVAKTTMTAANGKPFSVRTFKLSNAMKQSLVASGGCSAVAVAVASAFQANGGGGTTNTQSHEKLTTAGGGCSPVVNGGSNSSPVQIITNHHHQSPTAIAIVNGPSSKSLTPTVATIVTTNTGPLSNGGTSTDSSATPVIFKTPLAPKVASSALASFSNQSPQPQQLFLVNKNANDEDLAPKPINANSVRLTPILASTVKTPVSSDPDDEEMPKPKNKKTRICPTTGGRDELYQSPTLSGSTGGVLVNNFSVRYSDSPMARTPKSNGIRSRNNSFDYSNPDSPCIYSSPMSNNDFSSTSLYSTSSAYPCSPSSCSSTDYPTGRKSGRTRSETSLGQLTRKFISLLEESYDGSVNLNSASNLLNVQKRRIYDITNVLEGVGLLHKTSKNNIQWRGGLGDYISVKDTGHSSDQTSHYRNRKPPPLSLLFSKETKGKRGGGGKEPANKPIYELENDENRLDNLIKMARADLDKIKNRSSSHLYASYIDLRRVPEFKEQTVIGIRPPVDTMLEVSDPSENLQIWLKNSHGEIIEVYLCPQTLEEEQDKEPGLQLQNPDATGENIRPTHANDGGGNGTPVPSRSLMNAKLAKTNTESGEITPVDNNSEPRSEVNNAESGYQSYFGSGSTTPVMNKKKQEPTPDGASPTVDIEKTLLNSSPVYDESTGQHQVIVKREPSSVGDGQYSNASYAHAFICHDDEFGPLGSRTYTTQTEDHIVKSSPTSAGAGKQLLESPNRFGTSHYEQQQHHHHSSSSQHHHNHHQHPHQNPHHHSPISSSPLAWIPMEPVIVSEDYNFNLCDNEGIAELFDDNDLSLTI